MTGTERFGQRVESAYCASCGPTRAVWTGEKTRECWECGQMVYDDRETFETVGKQLGGRFAATGGESS